jgi:hypothetical protein
MSLLAVTTLPLFRNTASRLHPQQLFRNARENHHVITRTVDGRIRVWMKSVPRRADRGPRHRRGLHRLRLSPQGAFILLSAGRDIVMKHLRAGRHHRRKFESTKAKTARCRSRKKASHRCAQNRRRNGGVTAFEVIAASKTVRSEPIGGLHEYAGLLDRCPECLRWCRGDGRTVIDRAVGLPVVGPQRPIAPAEADTEIAR